MGAWGERSGLAATAATRRQVRPRAMTALVLTAGLMGVWGAALWPTRGPTIISIRIYGHTLPSAQDRLCIPIKL